MSAPSVDQYIDRLNEIPQETIPVLHRIRTLDKQVLALHIKIEGLRETALQRLTLYDSKPSNKLRNQINDLLRDISEIQNNMLALSRQKMKLSDQIYNCIDTPTEELNRDLAGRLKQSEPQEETKASKYKRPNKSSCTLYLIQSNSSVLQSPSTATAGGPPSGSWSSAKANSAKFSGSIVSVLRKKTSVTSGSARSAARPGASLINLESDILFNHCYTFPNNRYTIKMITVMIVPLTNKVKSHLSFMSLWLLIVCTSVFPLKNINYSAINNFQKEVILLSMTNTIITTVLVLLNVVVCSKYKKVLNLCV